MRSLFGLLLFVLALIFQSSLIAHFRLLRGTGDLMLLTLLAWLMHPDLPRPRVWILATGLLVGWASALPWPVALAAYAAAGEVALLLRRRLWQTSVLLYLFLVILGTLIVQGLTWMALMVLGIHIPWRAALTQVVLPSAILNFLLALPVHSVVTEVAAWVFPLAEEAP